MGVWAWLRPGNRIWKVISDPEKGTIQVFDEKGQLILEKKDLTREAMEVVEKNFLDVTATNVDAQRIDEELPEKEGGKKREDDIMYV